MSGPPTDVFENKKLPTAKEYIHYALSLPVSTVVIGIDSLQTLDAVIKGTAGLKPLSAAVMKSISDRAEVFRTTGFWIPGRGWRALSGEKLSEVVESLGGRAIRFFHAGDEDRGRGGFGNRAKSGRNRIWPTLCKNLSMRSRRH